mmetsp:Transcript_782/g.2048  ORF Transcript_782/g.2048 Transcript_782/m.2048 type:complete len:260 (-) Transcript_782:27-806(-)
MNSQWTVQAAHVRCLLGSEMASGNYDMDTSNIKPLEILTTMFTFELSKVEGGGASWFSRAAAKLECAATSALNVAQRSASWLTGKAVGASHKWLFRLNEDDSISILDILFLRLIGGLVTSMSHLHTAGKVAFTHGGLDFVHFVADPAQPLDSTLRVSAIRVAGDKAGHHQSTEARHLSDRGSHGSHGGAFDVHHPFVFSLTWGEGTFRFVCKRIALDAIGTKVSEEEDLSQLFEKLKVSPGGGHHTDGSATVCVGQSDV